MAAYAVFFDEGRTAKLYKGYDRPVKGEPYRGSTEPVFDFVEDIENDKAEVFVPYKNVLEQVSVETERGEIQPTTTRGWFKDCSKLAGVWGLSKLDTSKVTDMSEMFRGCSGLASIDLSAFDSKSVTNMSRMFSDCVGLRLLNLTMYSSSRFTTAAVTDMSFMFNNCSSLASLDLSQWDTTKVTSFNNMFHGCNLASVRLTGYMWSELGVQQFADFNLMTKKGEKLNYDTVKTFWVPQTFYHPDDKKVYTVFFDEGKTAKLYKRSELPVKGQSYVGSNALVFDYVEGIDQAGGAFSKYKESLEEVDVVDKGIAPVSTNSWFSSCKKLTSVDLGNLDTSYVTNMSGMFSDCSSLASLNLSGFDTSIVKDMSSMFSGCSSLASLDLSGFNTSHVENMLCMFLNCSSLASLDLSGFDTGNVTGKKNSMFYGCSGLKQVTLRERWKFPFADCDLPATMYVKDGNGSFAEYTGGFPTTKTDTYYTENGIKQAFAVVYDDGHGGRAAKLYNRAEVPSAGGVFDGNTVTEVITGIENMPGAFKDKKGGKKLTQVKVVDDGIQPTTTKGWFSGCSELAGVEGLSKLDTSKVTNMSGMFSACGGLTSLDVSKFDTAKVTDMGYMFSNCWRLTSLDVSKFATGNVTNMSGMFGQCSRLTSLNLSRFDTSSVTNMSEMFFACDGLTSLKLSSFDTAKVMDMSRMFWGCRRLT